MIQPNGPERLPPPALVMQMITGHWVSQLVGSLCRLGIPDVLAEQPLTSAVIAKKCGSNPDATYRVLRAATGDASGLKFERMLPTHSPFHIIEASKK